MARPVMLRHPRTGDLRHAYYGFSWACLLFGGWVPVFRRDFGTGLVLLLVGTLAGAVSYGIGWNVVALWLGFVYNKEHATALLERGYEFWDTPYVVAEARCTLGLPAAAWAA